MSDRWLVGHDRPYYPEVEEFEFEADARRRYREEVDDATEDGGHVATVWLARVVESATIEVTH